MLVITRKKGESILIGENIEIIVTKIDEGNVKLAISAPKEIAILRKELYREIVEENKSAVVVNDDLLRHIKKQK